MDFVGGLGGKTRRDVLAVAGGLSKKNFDIVIEANLDLKFKYPLLKEKC